MWVIGIIEIRRRNFLTRILDFFFLETGICTRMSAIKPTYVVLNSNLMIPDFHHIIGIRLTQLKFLSVAF